MEKNEREQLIQSYLAAYNQMNVAAMLEGLDENIKFENFSGEEKTHSLLGKQEFRRQAEEALNYFSERNQMLESFIHLEEETEVRIIYRAIAAMDFPNGIKKGQEIQLVGRSIFRFSNGKISEIRDYS